MLFYVGICVVVSKWVKGLEFVCSCVFGFCLIM